jgi:hypothetical protein
MALDKKLYRKAHELYRQWNEAEYAERVRSAGTRPPDEGWRQFIELWEAFQQMGFKKSEHQRQQRLADWDEYHRRIQKLEAWRKSHGKSD